MHPQRQPAVRRSSFKPSKRLGQHFLRDRSVLDRIVSAAEIGTEDVVIEVGPGLGILTEALGRQGPSVIAVELDSRLVAPLKKRLSPYPRVTIVQRDILKVAPGQLLDDHLPASERTWEYKVVANLPYYITSPVLSHFLESQHRPERMVVMVQKEVGETIVAGPGKMRLLSVKTQFYSRPSVVCRVPATAFHPAPKVDSVVIRLDVHSEPPIAVSDVAGFFEVVMHGFSAPRKQLRNALAHSMQLSTDEVSSLLEKAGVECIRRAETLSLEEWRIVWEVFSPWLSHHKSSSPSYHERSPSCCSEWSEESRTAHCRFCNSNMDPSFAMLPQNDIEGE